VSEINDEGSGMDEQKPENAAEEPPQTDAPAIIAGLDADYHIDYENGTIPIGDLPIGARVVDPSWEWEFRTGDNYSGSGKVKPVTWIVVAKDHYDGLEPHVTLLADELIGKHTFDNGTKEVNQYGSNHWGDSGTANASHGLRPWLNSTGIHSSGGFYRVFSESFKAAVLATTVPNKEWESGTVYSTEDYVFLPSTTELGDSGHDYTYTIGSVYPYFSGAGYAKRIAHLGGETWWYWTRSPDSRNGSSVRVICRAGTFYDFIASDYIDIHGVPPALNLKSETLVSEIRN
jgi:hypothetical protein